MNGLTPERKAILVAALVGMEHRGHEALESLPPHEREKRKQVATAIADVKGARVKLLHAYNYDQQVKDRRAKNKQSRKARTKNR